MDSEYVFFEASLRDRFIAYLSRHGIASEFRADPIGGYVVALAHAVSDATESSIELEYETLMDLQRDLLDAADGEDGRDVLGVTVKLPDGKDRLVRLPAAYGRRLVEHFSFEEIHELVSVIASDLLGPEPGSLCQKD